MIFHLFFLTITISKRRYTVENIRSERNQQRIKEELLYKRAQYVQTRRFF
ncbi:YrzI family small protein [Evansella cellulosilytica]|uniref:YrzI family small protein n=1 Tax=Evansella cellulosilytica (strain ATCC 21833 / DSM 2522 / FERM P-1141 / JCM 9156 / N-4) TaxID=649639 RepID=E6TX30_EVAC2|nr:YrzI family small protein [Evansella cellulosilytica]ADU31119.1 hypothetical protein Bcell_2867 [Evansella cellulosilytica DSM 2522]